MRHRSALLLNLLLTVSLVLAACGEAATSTPQPGGQAPAASPQATEAQTPAATQPEAGGTDSGEIIFLSTQARPIEEAEKMRNQILEGFQGTVEFIPEDAGPFNDRIISEAQSGRGSVSLLGALHGDFASLAKAGYLQDLSQDLAALEDRQFPEAFIELGKLGSDQQQYIPWMQATYIMAANKEALEFLPDGADINALTWEQLRDWGKNMLDATGEQKLGFPAGEGGLMHRFLQGYIYPSYTGGMVTGYRTPEAAQMWELMRDLWQYVNPQSIAYEFMQEPLLSDEVWVAFDHTARLINAFSMRPDDFVAFPAPAGPAGRGFMPVIAGLAIPTSAANPEGARALIEHLTTPETQIETLRAIAFFPISELELPEDIDPGIRLEAEAVAAQTNSPDALPALLPVGLGDRNGEFNKIYRDTFNRIIIDGGDIQTVLNEEGENLATLLQELDAPCWPPDEPSEGACQVK